MPSPDDKRPIVVIRRTSASEEGGYHGAWKIALADFMTSMMALFLVLWIMASATPKQLHGIANYFNMPLSAAFVSGNKNSASSSAIPGGGPDPIYSKGETESFLPRAPTRMSSREFKALNQLRQDIVAQVKRDPQLKDMLNHLRMEMTPRGLRIEVVDSANKPMFKLGSANVEPYMQRLLLDIAPILNKLPNRISIYGHTDSIPYAGGVAGYSNWELSAARADASRQILVQGGFDNSKLLSVTGVADRIPLKGTKPTDPSNRRIELMVLTPQAAANIRRTE